MLHMRATTMANYISLRAKFKQLAGFYQVTTNIQEVYSIEMPEQTRDFLDFWKGLVSFDVVKMFKLPLDCAKLSGYYNKLTFMMAWPIVVVATLIAGHVAKQWFELLRLYRRALKGLPDEEGMVRAQMSAAELRKNLKQASKRGVLMALPGVSLISFLVFPSVSSIAFRAWACVEFDMDTKYDIDNKPLPRAAPDVQSFMRDDLRIQCGTPEHDDAVTNPNPNLNESQP